MYGLYGSYWFQGNDFMVPQGYNDVLPLGGYAGILPNGMTSLPWQNSGDTGG